MKILLSINVFILFSLLIFAQEDVVSTKNESSGLELDLLFTQLPYTQKQSAGKNTVEYFGATNESSPGTPKLPSRTYFVAIPPGSKIQIHLTNQKYNILPNAEIMLNPEVFLSTDSIVTYKESMPDLSKFISDQYPTAEVELINYTWIRDYYCAIIRINTHSYFWKRKEIRELVSAKVNVDFSEIQSFTINQSPIGEFDKMLDKIILNYKSASQFRSLRPNIIQQDTSGYWIDYTKEYVKLKIPEDGIYRVDSNQLTGYGINVQGLNPKTLKLFLKGKEVPIFVFGEDDLSFDPVDYIEFWSEKNYGSPDYKEIVSLGEDYKNYLDRYSDTTTVWLTWDGNDGKRINLQNISTPGISDTLSSHTAFQHFENDERLWYYDAVLPRVQLPDWQENKVWTWQFLGNGGSIPFNFDARDFISNTSVNVTARMISNASDRLDTNSHRFGLGLNSASPQDTIVFNYKETVNFDATYNSNQLVSGNNIVTIFGMQNDSLRFHQALIDWLDIEYERLNIAINDSILLRVSDNLQSSVRVIKVSNIVQPAANILVYKIKPQLKKITAFDITNSVLTFTDTVSTNDEYFIVKESLTRPPIFMLKKNFTNLRAPNRNADYIIISNKILQTSAQDYLNFINNNYPLRNELIYVDDIYDEFAYGYDKPEAIRDFLESANNNWIAPAPSYLLLLGDANYDYKNKITPPPSLFRKNIVPSFGDPVSDAWFTMWDTSNVNLPQMFVGRIPATSDAEVNFYLEKHQTYLNRRLDDFNKRYLFFSGGDPDDPNQIEQLKFANNFVLNNFVKPAPVGGDGIHFYKTVDPPTNFGPYTPEQIDNAIDSSGLFISYIGHSGTETWDNGITEVTDIQPIFSDRFSLISDFGCSTGKFAEPDVDAFGELFVSASPDGQAIAYLGNASWGYVSTSVNFPQLFYEQLLLDSSQVISQAHYLAKVRLLNQFGTSDVNRVFNYSNILFGDPLLGFKLPGKPNFSVNSSSFTTLNNFPLDTDDSLKIKIELINFGNVPDDSVLITISDNYLASQNYFSEYKIHIPLYKHDIYVNIPIKGKVGEHVVSIEIDKNDLIDEIYEDDNIASFNYIVYSTSVRPVEAEQFYNSDRNEFKFLNPVFLIDKSISTIKIAIADNPDFSNLLEQTISMDTLYTISQIPQLQQDKRFWWKARLDIPQSVWSEPYSFLKTNLNYDWLFSESFSYPDIQFNNVIFDSTDKAWKLTNFENILEISSAGGDDGEFGSIKLNGSEKLPSTYYWGIATAIIDSITLEPSDFNYFLYWNSYSDTLLINYIDSLPSGTFLAMTICSDGAQSVLGFNSGTPVRQAIETLGSLYVDSVFYRDSWCILGKKGATQGTVPEAFSKRFSGPANLDSSLTLYNDNGWIEFPTINNSSKWLNVTKFDSIPSGSSLDYIPLGIKSDGSVDTLNALQFYTDIADIRNIDVELYPSLKFISKFQANELDEAPTFSELGVKFNTLPELATNYQVVTISNDSVLIGENVGLQFFVYNVGGSTSDNFSVKVEVIDEDNSHQTILNNRIDSLRADDKKYFELDFNTSSGSGSKSFLITIDSENEVRELFEDNNFFSIPFYVQPDTTIPTITLTFDGYDIVDGEYISPKPEIHIELSDESLLPITDPSAILVYSNENLIPSDTSIINYAFSPENPKVTVDFIPELSDGEYTLKILWKDSEGNIVDSSGVEKYFQVSNEAQLLFVYNYPNPTSGETYFTFKLTQIPDEIQIKIYTIAGRLIKEIDLTSSELKFDFNKIYWDGKDEDRDALGNGVYLYKVIMQAGDKSQDVTQKLAIVK